MAQTPETNSEEQTRAAASSAADRAERTTRSAAATAERTLDAERRSFAEASDTAARTGQAGANAARDMAGAAAGATRRLAEGGRQASHEVADLWRSSLDPFASMQLEVTRMVDDFWRGAFGLGGFPTMRASRPFAGLGPAALFGQPPVDVKETAGAYLLEIEVPGLNADDLDLGVEGDFLTVRGHKAEEREDAGAAYRISERRFGRFERRFPLAPDTDRGGIEAQYRDGVLRITLPKQAAAERPRSRIEISK